jgi:hypothetical protein
VRSFGGRLESAYCNIATKPNIMTIMTRLYLISQRS